MPKGNVPPTIIAGMHRSGTTLLSHMLQAAGLFLGWRREENEESRTFLEINKWLLLQAGGAWDFPPPPRQFADPEARELCLSFMRYAMQSIWFSFYLGRPHRSVGDSLPRLERPWGWKDPRNTLTLPLWAELYPDARVIYVVRHGVDVAASLLDRHEARIAGWKRKFDHRKHFFWFRLRKRRFETALGGLADAFELWQRYQQISADSEALFGDRFLRVRFEDLVGQPEKTLRRIATHIDLQGADFSSASALVRPDRAYAHRSDPSLRAFAETVRAELGRYDYAEETAPDYSTPPRAG